VRPAFRISLLNRWLPQTTSAPGAGLDNSCEGNHRIRVHSRLSRPRFSARWCDPLLHFAQSVATKKKLGRSVPATTRAPGTSSSSISKALRAEPVAPKNVRPVRLPPGRLRLGLKALRHRIRRRSRTHWSVVVARRAASTAGHCRRSPPWRRTSIGPRGPAADLS